MGTGRRDEAGTAGEDRVAGSTQMRKREDEVEREEKESEGETGGD